MPTSASGSLLSLVEVSRLNADIRSFIIDCQSRRLSHRTIDLYQAELGYLRQFLEQQRVTRVEDIAPTHLRAYLVQLATHRNAGGCHVAYRITKTFLRWWQAEYEPHDWRNPITKVQAPKMPKPLLEPIPLEHIRAMLATCPPRTFRGDRGRAILLSLLDTGCRASEFLALNIGDVNMTSGAVIIHAGKGGKGRVVFLGAKARKAILAYLRHRPEAKPGDPLWVTENGKRMAYRGLDSLIRRRAEAAKVPEPSLHSFRRAFALLSLRNGANVYALQRLMGHADLTILRRYLAQTEQDLQRAHEESGPVDNLL